MKRIITLALAVGLFAGQINASDKNPENTSSLRKNGYIFAKNALKTTGGLVLTGISAAVTAVICKATLEFGYDDVIEVLTKIVPEPVGVFDAYNKISGMHAWAKFWHNNRPIIAGVTAVVGGSATLYSAYKTLRSAIDTVFFVDGDRAEQKSAHASE